MERSDSTSSETLLTSEQKLAAAHGIIAHFFEATDLDYMRLDLWNLLKAATGETLYSFAGEPSTVLYVERHLLDMIHACNLLLDVAQENGEDLDVPSFEPFTTAQIQADRQYVREMKVLDDQYSGVIRRLTLAESQRPVLAIKRVFSVYGVDEWKEILRDWVEYGLSKVSICEATGACAEILQYELLEVLLEVVYLVSRQDERIPYQKRRLQKLAGSKAIIELLIAALEPELIFEIKHANLIQSDHELYRNLIIVLPDGNHKPFKELEPVIELITAGEQRLSCSLHKLSDLFQRLENGHVYFSVFCRAENLIYQQKAITLPKVQEPIIQELVNKSSASFAAGIAKAKAFQYGATCYHQAGEDALAMFTLQQAVETTFRTMAICFHGSERKTHSIRSLKRFNQRIAPELNDIFPGGCEQEERLLQILEDAYLETRYNPEYKIEHKDLQIIFLRVSRMLELAETSFEQRMQTVRNDD